MISELAVLTALTSAILYGLGAVLMKVLFNRTDFGSLDYTVFETMIQSLFAFLLVVISWEFVFNNWKLIGFLTLAGLIYGISIFLYNYVIEKDEASRGSQLASLETIVTPAFAILLLGESPSQSQLIGIVLIASGILILTIEKDVIKLVKTAKSAVLPIFIALGFWGIEDVMLKYALGIESVVYVFFWVRLTGFLSILIISSAHKETRQSIKSIISNPLDPKYNLRLAFITALISATGLVLTVYTYSIIELSIASPIVGSYPIFAIIFLYIAQKIDYITDEDEKEPLLKRLISAILFLIGIITISVI